MRRRLNKLWHKRYTEGYASRAVVEPPPSLRFAMKRSVDIGVFVHENLLEGKTSFKGDCGGGAARVRFLF